VQAHAQAKGKNSCVTRAEFRRAKRGMIKRRVHRIFDTRGRRTSLSIGGGTRDEYREYRARAALEPVRRRMSTTIELVPTG
jgi:hypothetical protein